jgi:hypothetical protein
MTEEQFLRTAASCLAAMVTPHTEGYMLEAMAEKSVAAAAALYKALAQRSKPRSPMPPQKRIGGSRRMEK